MPVVVCFGDSNTWGSDPATRNRYGPDIRWTGVLRQQLGAGYTVIEEGLNGRTTNLDDVIEENRNGRSYLPGCLESHRPFDLITIMLGTNDLKARFNRGASDIAISAATLGMLALKSGCGIDGQAPRVLLIAPPPVIEVAGFDGMLAGAAQKSQEFAGRYRFFAGRYGLHFMDAGAVVKSSPTDGVHLEAEEHAKLGKAVASRILEIL
ncbi:SGNH/GDSL hydrolase family protein [soil metagenome]